MERKNSTVFFFILPTYITVKAVVEYKMADRYYCMIMEFLDLFSLTIDSQI